MTIPSGSPRLWLGVALAAAVTVGASVAFGSIPDSGVIHACYTNNSLRLIDPAATQPKAANCKQNETAIDWNQQGPPGTPGLAGSTGSTGPTGATGPAGPNSLATTEVTAEQTIVPGLPAVYVDATCPSGDVAVSGGYHILNFDPTAPPTVLSSWRVPGHADKWRVVYYNPGSFDVDVQTIAYCAPGT